MINYNLIQYFNRINSIHIRYCYNFINAKIVYYSANYLHAAGDRM